MFKRTLTLLTLLSLSLLPMGPRAMAGDAPPAPIKMAGGWWAGAVPPGADPAGPVLVFVAGLHQPATSWWGPTRYYGHNGMYATAYAHGLRTAFIEMDDGAGDDMWTNGRILADRLTAITGYYGVAKVALVTHSKGGVDANTAAAFYGAAPHIASVISLSSPNYGSPLADLAMSQWASWLADLVGERDAGVQCLQTGYMQWYRSTADSRTDDRGVPYYTISGTGWGPALSALRLGGVYLSAWGKNDGMVPEGSAHKPGATHLATLPLDHDAMRTDRTWPTVAMALGAGAAAPQGSGASSADPAMATAQVGSGTVQVATGPGGHGPGVAWPSTPGAAPGLAGAPAPEAGAVLRGGLAHGRVDVSLPVESGARRADLFVLTSAPAAVTAVAPDGRRFRASPEAAPTEVFATAHLSAVSLVGPAAGEWRVEVTGRGDVGYLVIAQIDSPAAAALQLPGHPLAPGAEAHVGLALSPSLADAHLRASAILVATPSGAAVPSAAPAAFATAAVPGATGFDPHGAGVRVAVPQGAGVYPVAVTVSGRLADGSPFERSFATSLAVAPPGLLPPGAAGRPGG